MSTDPLGFSDNWAYLKTELNWLDRVLMLAVARYRQDKRSVDRVAQTPADRVSSHWWKGVVSLEGNVAYDEHRNVSKSSSAAANSAKRVGYQQQLEARIQASYRQGTVLALPSLRDRLNLTPFEKNVVLISLAPEVNRRYARLYRYLQSQDERVHTDLPTVELVLRLLCRNDSEWRTARKQLAQQSPLLQHGLLHLLQRPHDTFLTTTIKLSEPATNYLLAESPSTDTLDALIQYPGSDFSPLGIAPASVAPGMSSIAPPEKTGGEPPVLSPINPWEFSASSEPLSVSASPSIIQQLLQPQAQWTDLVLPKSVLEDLQHLGHRVRSAQGNRVSHLQPPPGTLALLAGSSGTGKTLAAEAIAHDLQTALHWVDLAEVAWEADEYLLREIQTDAPTVLLIKSAHRWLSAASLHASSAPPWNVPLQPHLHRFLAQRRQFPGLTLFSVHEVERIAPSWRRYLDQVLPFGRPNPSDRLRLWQRVCQSYAVEAETLDLSLLSTLSLTGGEIVQLVHDGAIAAAARPSPLVLEDIQNALQRRGHDRALRQLTRLRTHQSTQTRPAKSAKRTKPAQKREQKGRSRRSAS